MTDSHIVELQKQNRLLKFLLGLTVLTLIVSLTLGVKLFTRTNKFSEIDVERINVINADGKPAMVLANRDRLPDPILEGKTISSDRGKIPGILFYNSVGDESGGLIFEGQLGEKNKPQSAMHFSMDRFGGDQQLALGHYEKAGFMETGLRVLDRGIGNQDEGQIDRLFVGRTRGLSSAIILSDAKGRPRIMMYVTPEGESIFDFLDENGKVVRSLGQAQK